MLRRFLSRGFFIGGAVCVLTAGASFVAGHYVTAESAREYIGACVLANAVGAIQSRQWPPHFPVRIGPPPPDWY